MSPQPAQVEAEQPWHRRGTALVRELEFRDSDEALAFANRVAEETVAYGRRPS